MNDAPDPLLAELERARAQVADLTDELEGIIASAVDANLDDEHDPDGSTVGFERARVTALLARASAQLASLEQAAGRLADGDYGRCATCGGFIGAERLAAVPAAVRCMACEMTRREASGREISRRERGRRS